MIKHALVLLCLISPLALQNDALTRHVVRSHKNGKPYVVVYTHGAHHEKVKEELFFTNGSLDYVGHYKNGIEHGEWRYYWENGRLKSYELYDKGREEGLHYECDSLGRRTKEFFYRKGILLRELDLAAKR
jgi:antitoxin component YwqK of YwqJK toxin-antitoxin module